MISCPEARDLMVLYMGGLLDPLRRVQLEGHVDACADCQQEYEAVRLGYQLILEFYPPVEMDVEGFVAKVDGLLPDEPPPKVPAAARWLVALAGFALLLGLAASAGSLVGAGEVSATDGLAGVLRMGGEHSSKAQKHARLYPGDTVDTGSDGTCIFVIGRYARVTLLDDTSVRLIGSRGGLLADLEIDAGDMKAVVQRGLQTLTVFTPAGRMKVTGTARIQVTPDAHSPGGPLVSLEVNSGTVEWAGEWGLDTIVADMRAEATPGSRPLIRPMPASPGQGDEEILYEMFPETSEQP